jgi:hypothetical protein
MHDVDPAHIVLTGAMVYDQWFARRASSTREEFCARVGLDPARPILLYLCSSPFIAPDEVVFIEQWITAIRSAPDARVSTAGILIRPHPENRQPWHRFDAMGLQNVSVWPRGGASPVDAASRNDFFDSMYHSAGAVGINTSAQIECGIVGRPVFSIRTEAYRRTQDGTLHFRHLTSEGGGLLRLADDFETHVRQIAAAFDDPEGTRRQVDGFVKSFTRPFGLDVEATPRIVEEIERLGAAPAPAPRGLPLYAYPLRALLYPIAVLMALVRRMTRVSRKRSRQLRPVTATGTLVRMTLVVFDWLFRFRPIRHFAKQHIVPRAVLALVSRGCPDRGGRRGPARASTDSSARTARSSSALGQRGGLRAALLDPVPQLGEGASSIQRRPAGRGVAREDAHPGIATSPRTTSSSSTTTRRRSSVSEANSGSRMARRSHGRCPSSIATRSSSFGRARTSRSAICSTDVHVPAVSQVLAEPRIGGHGRELRRLQAAPASRDQRACRQASG